MNKTISINLGGFFFHIDENAYQTLNQYFEAVKRSLAPEGRDEIINDIESRIAELFQEKLNNEKQVISSIEVENVISIMGQPEDYRIDEDTNYKENTKYTNNSTHNKPKKLYRDKDNAMLGGVLSGLGHYFGIDVLWLRIAMVILFFGFGTGILIYLILWILVPQAVTTSQKLEMKGEPINISNIEKKVKEGFSGISDTIHNLDHQKIANTAKTGANQIASTFGTIFLSIFKVFSKIIGAFIVFVASLLLITVLVCGIIMIFSTSLPEILALNYINTPFDFDIPLWIQGILFILSAGIPLLFFTILGLKLLVNTFKPINNYVKYTLLAVWILSIILIAYIGVKQATEIGFSGKNVKKEQLLLQPTDTLFVKMNFNDYYAKNVRDRETKKFTHDQNNNKIIYSNNVKIHLMKTDLPSPFIQMEKTASGNSYNDAKSRAEKINYNFGFQENKLILDNYFITDFENKFRNQEVHIYLYLPEGITIFPDESISRYLSSNNSDIDVYYGEEGKYYQLKNDELECLSCITEKDNDTINENFSIKINNKEVKIKVKNDEVNIQSN